MTNPNNQTNGASLEDCHTNFFALTDLCGIKWRKVVWVGGGLGEWGEPGNPPSDPLEDPVLSSYVKCISADMLCVWRRVVAPTSRSPGDMFDQLGLTGPPPPPPQMSHHPPLSLAAAKELWIFWYGEEPDLSSLVAPELLSADGEQGSWESGLSYECRSLLFKALHNLIERCLLSRDFVRIGKWYVQPYDSSEKMLEKSGHYSFAFDFFVHGESQVCASVDVRQHPPIRTLLASHIQQAALHSQPPPVHVILAPFGLAGTLTGQSFRNNDPHTQRLLENWRLFYPIDRGPHHSDLPAAVEVIVGGMKLKYPSHYVLLTDLDDSTHSLFSNHNQPNHPPPMVAQPLTRGLNRVGLLAERVWQESLLVHNMNNSSNASITNNISVTNTTSNSNTSNTGSSGGTTSTPSVPSTTPVGGPPQPNNPGSPQHTPGQWNFVDPTRKQTCSCSCKLNCGASMGQNDSVPIASVGSPGPPESPAPSVPPPTDPTMPLLSPQPPQHHISQSPLLDDKVVSTPIDFNAPKSVPSISNQMLSPYGEEVKTTLSESGGGGPGSVGTIGGGKTTPLAARTPAPAPTPPPQPAVQQQPPPAPKRPLLSSSDYEEALAQEIRPSDLLYDYSLLDAWLNHPVKRFKPSQPSQPPTPQQTFIKQEPNLPNSNPIEENGYSGPRGPGDPYDFNEEGMSGMHINTFKRVPIKEEEKGMVNGTGPSPSSQGKMASGNLFTSEGLQVTYNDLDQIFNHSDDNSGDETLNVTPPSSNKGPEDCTGQSNGQTILPSSRLCLTNGQAGILRPEELSKMFPTPPSLEPSLEHPLLSPGDDHPQSLSPHHQPIQDWSFVFKPSPISKFVGSSKYAPLTTLPSHSLPPVTLPANALYKPSWSLPHQEKQTNPTTASRGLPANSGPGSGGPRTPSIPALPPATPTGAASSPAPPAPWGRAPPPPYSPAQYPPPATVHQHQPPPEANSLVVIVLLSDTAFNIFRDHNFDSCTLCVCNAGPKVVGNIRGSDAGMYLISSSGSPYSPLSPSPHLPLEEEHIRCNCGFSAVVNRRLSHRAGLFIEDEFEITGLLEEPVEKETAVCVGRAEMELMAGQCLAVNSSSNALYRAATQVRPATPLPPLNILSLRDSNQVSLVALEQGRIAAQHTQSMCKMEEISNYGRPGSGPVHRWGFLRAKGPPSNQDIVRVMKQLQPLLQEAIQKKCTTRLWEAPTVSGPLTWRQFHRLAGRGTDDRCEPQPIPSLLMGREKDWITLAPYAVHLWEKLLLEPYSYSRDIAYVVVAPDNEFVLASVRTFFKELSCMYEVCRLGRHVPITKVLRDGILRVGKTAAVKLAKEPLDEWFSNLTDTYQANMLKLYAQVCRHHLAPHLSQVPLDKTLLDPPEGSNPAPRSTIGASDQPNTPKQMDPQDDGSGSGSEYTFGGTSCGNNGCNSSIDDDGSDPPMIVVYLVEPFTVGADSPELQRLSCVGLLKAFNTVIANVPENLRSNITLQVVSLESILELGRSGETNRRIDHMRTLAISVFCQARKTLIHGTNNIKALTGFGTAASNELFLKSKDEKNRAPYKVYTPAYILAKSKDKPLNNPAVPDSESGVSSSDHCSVLYVSYCLSEDQRWLLATATDEQGLLLETVSINVHIPNRARRRRASARRAGLQKLMDFMLGVMSQSVTPWRLVVGRVGRIGHGELKGWSWLLSRKSLLKASKNLKDICGQCNLLYPHDVPCILSACLVSLEPDSALRLMPDQFTPDERFSQASVKCSLSTPQDVSATHILVFPTSATTQSSQTAFQEQHINDPDLGDDELFSVLNDDMPEGMSDFHDIFSTWPEADGTGGPRSPEGAGGPGRGGRPDSPSPTPPHSHPHSPYQHSIARTSGEGSEEVGTVLQQPLALGYLVSTAPTGRMPRWFWSACPHLETVTPPFLKNALHLHSTAVLASSDELLQQQTAVAGHALDSQYTTDVLRYVLEGYNALSWLALDSNTHDRLSCLPVHMQVLMQLYHMTAALA